MVCTTALASGRRENQTEDLLCRRAKRFLHCPTPYWVNESSLRPCTPWKRCASKDQIPEGKLGGGLKLMYKHRVHGLGLGNVSEFMIYGLGRGGMNLMLARRVGVGILRFLA